MVVTDDNTLKLEADTLFDSVGLIDEVGLIDAAGGVDYQVLMILQMLLTQVLRRLLID